MTVLARGSRGARTEDVRRGNLSTLLRYVHVHGPTGHLVVVPMTRVAERRSVGHDATRSH